MHFRRSVLLAAAILASAVATGAFAQTLTRIRVEIAPAVPGNPAVILVDLDNSGGGYCGASLKLGDGSSRDLRFEEGKTTLRIEHRYAQPGNYSVSVEGKALIRGLRSVLPCLGSAQTASVSVGTVVARQENGASGSDALSAYTVCMIAAYGELIGHFPNPLESAARARIACDTVRSRLRTDLESRLGTATPQLLAKIDVEILRDLRKASP